MNCARTKLFWVKIGANLRQGIADCVSTSKHYSMPELSTLVGYVELKTEFEFRCSTTP